MNRRKEILKEYKERKLQGGVYRITNTVNGKYLIDHVANLQSAQNRFKSSVIIGGLFHHKLKKDWQELGAQAFKFEVIEELEQQTGQSQAEFMVELQTLEGLARANFNPAEEY